MPRLLPTLTAVDGVRVGCAEDPDRTTGVTAVVLDRLAPTVVDVRGPASGTFDTASLALDATFGRRDALFLSGGSVYGLDAARGVRTALLERGRGESAFGSEFPLPRVSGAVLYDLPRKNQVIPDYLPLGFAAAQAAGRDPVPIGRVGAGRGARIAKYAGIERSLYGGQSSAALPIDPRHAIGALVVFNSVGAIRSPGSGRWLAGARGARGGITPPMLERLGAGRPGTTLAVVVTDLPVDRRTLWVVAEHAHDGLARTVVPAHTATEGDTVFVATTADPSASLAKERRPGATADRLSGLVEELMGQCAERLFAPIRRGPAPKRT